MDGVEKDDADGGDVPAEQLQRAWLFQAGNAGDDRQAGQQLVEGADISAELHGKRAHDLKRDGQAQVQRRN